MIDFSIIHHEVSGPDELGTGEHDDGQERGEGGWCIMYVVPRSADPRDGIGDDAFYSTCIVHYCRYMYR